MAEEPTKDSNVFPDSIWTMITGFKVSLDSKTQEQFQKELSHNKWANDLPVNLNIAEKPLESTSAGKLQDVNTKISASLSTRDIMQVGSCNPIENTEERFLPMNKEKETSELKLLYGRLKNSNYFRERFRKQFENIETSFPLGDETVIHSDVSSRKLTEDIKTNVLPSIKLQQGLRSCGTQAGDVVCDVGSHSNGIFSHSKKNSDSSTDIRCTKRKSVSTENSSSVVVSSNQTNIGKRSSETNVEDISPNDHSVRTQMRCAEAALITDLDVCLQEKTELQNKYTQTSPVVHERYCKKYSVRNEWKQAKDSSDSRNIEERSNFSTKPLLSPRMQSHAFPQLASCLGSKIDTVFKDENSGEIDLSTDLKVSPLLKKSSQFRNHFFNCSEPQDRKNDRQRNKKDPTKLSHSKGDMSKADSTDRIGESTNSYGIELQQTNWKRRLRKPSPSEDSSFKSSFVENSKELHCSSKTETAESLITIPKSEHRLDSVDFVKNTPSKLTINPVYFERIDYGRFGSCDTAYSKNSGEVLKRLEEKPNNLDEPIDNESCNEERNATISEDEIQNLPKRVIFCRNTQPVPKIKDYRVICLCDDCYSKTLETVDEITENETLPIDQEVLSSSHQSPSSVNNCERCLESEETLVGTREGSAELKLEIEDLSTLCKMVNDHLLNLRNIDEDLLQKSVKTLTSKWLQAAAKKNSDRRRVRNYLKYFQTYSDNLEKMILYSSDEKGNNALHFAYGNNRFDIADELLNTTYGPDLLTKENELGHSPVMICSISQPSTKKDWNLVEKTIKMSDINAISGPCNQTALMNAASRGSTTMVRFLLESGADPNQQDMDGSTALMYASQHGHKDCVHLLLENPQCDPFLRDCDEQTACTIALGAGHKDTALLIYLLTKTRRESSKARMTTHYQRKGNHPSART